jgi:hypothetical protein
MRKEAQSQGIIRNEIPIISFVLPSELGFGLVILKFLYK